MALPACGLYRTTGTIGGVPAGRLVMFHNHGNPGAGIFQPESWTLNRANFHSRGTALANDDEAKKLRALPAEGLYMVKSQFTCCKNDCQTFQVDQLVQLGYNGEGKGILFTPTLTDTAMTLPERGTAIDDVNFEKLHAVKVHMSRPAVH